MWVERTGRKAVLVWPIRFNEAVGLRDSAVADAIGAVACPMLGCRDGSFGYGPASVADVDDCGLSIARNAAIDLEQRAISNLMVQVSDVEGPVAG
ncbi:hypothetical protein [Plantactinospora sp. DSM 117369]